MTRTAIGTTALTSSPTSSTACTRKGGFLVSSLPGVSSNEELSGAMQLCNFGIRANSVHSSGEKSNLWCGRMSLVGTRQVAMVLSIENQQFMRSSGIAGVDPKTFFRDLREEGLKKVLGSKIEACSTTNQINLKCRSNTSISNVD